jgi:DNA uptake protein ComE-like DNA-binding protein
MFRNYLRDFFLLPRGEQRALIALSLLLILALGIRIAVQCIPQRSDPGLHEFMDQIQETIAAIEAEDSLINAHDTVPGSGYAVPAHSKPHISYYAAIGPASLDLNTADSLALLPLPGIGPVLAGRIIRYRELLGGFYHPSQLSEVYGLRPETVALVEEFIVTDTLHLRQLPLNSSSFSELLRHPYLDYGDVLALIRYRESMGPVTSLQEIRAQKLLEDSVLSRIAPYLDLSIKRP